MAHISTVFLGHCDFIAPVLCGVPHNALWGVNPNSLSCVFILLP